MKKHILYVLFLFVSFSLTGQQNLRFKRLSTVDGLSSNIVFTMYQDKLGYMWFGTDDGLNKFDGHTIEVFKNIPDDSTSLPGNWINGIYEDSNSNLWIGTSSGASIYKRYNNTFQRFQHDPTNLNGVSGKSVTHFCEDQQGNMWIGTYDGGLNRYAPENNSFVHYQYNPKNDQSLSDNNITWIFIDSRNNFWVGTSNGLNLFFPEKNTFVRFKSSETNPNTLSSNSISKIVEDQKGNLWISTKNGINLLHLPEERYQQNDLASNGLKIQRVFEKKNKESKVFSSKNIGDALDVDIHDNLWMGVDVGGGLVHFDRQHRQFYRYSLNDNNDKITSNNSVINLLMADDGTLWVSAFKEGVYFYNHRLNNFRHYRHDPKNSNSLSNVIVSNFLEDPNGNIRIGTFGEGLDVFHPENMNFNHIPFELPRFEGLTNEAVTVQYYDRFGNYLVGVFDAGLWRLNGNRLERYPMGNNHILDKSFITHLTEDKKGNLWIGTFNKGLFRYTPGTRQLVQYKHDPDKPESISKNRINFIHFDKDGDLWIGTDFGGLNLMKKGTERFIKFKHNDKDPHSISHDNVIYIYEDSKTNLWFGTQEGINLYNPVNNIFHKINESDGLCNNIVYGIIEDDSGDFWIPTSNGLSQIKLSDFYKLHPNFYLSDITQLPEIEIRNYYIEDGLQDNSFSQKACMKASDGKIYLGGSNGFNVFHPSELTKNKRIPPFYITDFKVFNQSIPIGENEDGRTILEKSISFTDHIVLKYTDYAFSFEFVAINYYQPEDNQYEYMLEGLDKQWYQTSADKRFANYTGLPPGEYIFKLRASNNDGVWNDNVKEIKVSILPPFWKTWWFKFIIALVLIGLVALYVKVNQAQSKSRQEELEKLVNERTTELRMVNDRLKERQEEIVRQNREIEKQRDKLAQKNEKLEMLTENVREMADKVHEADQAKLRFFINISHEFRTPLTLITGPLQNLMEKNPEMDFQIKKALNVVQRNANRLLYLINQMLDFRKVETNTMQVQLSKGNFAEFVELLYHSFDFKAEKQDIDYWLSIDSSIKHKEIWFDKDIIDKIFVNLVNNAFKYTKSGGNVHLTVKEAILPENISVKEIIAENDFELAENTNVNGTRYVCMRICDSGIGIPEDKLSRIFERFYQVNPSGGTGIGLALVKELTELNNGYIFATSNVGEGSCFTVFVPENEKDIPNAQVNREPMEHNTAPVSITNEQMYDKPEDSLPFNEPTFASLNKSHSIIIIEDNEDLRSYLKGILEDHFTIYEASNGQDGLDQIMKHYPDLVLSDIMMEGMNGVELCKLVKETEETSHIPVILLTAKNSMESKLNGFASGADDYITKPFDPKILQARISGIVKNREKLKERFSKELYVDPKVLSSNPADQKLLRKAIDLVTENISEPEFSISEFVQGLGMSRTLVYLKFKKLTNQSVSEFIKSIRLKKAAELLISNEFTVSEIAYQVGFKDSSYFTKCFNKQFGQSPTEFVNEIRNKKKLELHEG